MAWRLRLSAEASDKKKHADAAKFGFFVLKKFGRMRMAEMFDVVLVFPQSQFASFFAPFEHICSWRKSRHPMH